MKQKHSVLWKYAAALDGEMLGTAWAVMGLSVVLWAMNSISLLAPGCTTRSSALERNSQVMSAELVARNCTRTWRCSSSAWLPS